MLDKHFHSTDRSTNISFPETINVHEHKAPTDESIRLMEEMHEKAIANIISKTTVSDNLLAGECWCINDYASLRGEYKVVVKFKVNGHEYLVEKYIDSNMIHDARKDFNAHSSQMREMASDIMLWYCLKHFAYIAYEQITKKEFPKHLIK